MMISTLFSAGFSKSGSYIVLAGVIFMGACSTNSAQTSTSAPVLPGVVVIGVTQKAGLNAPVDKAQMSKDTATLLAGRSDLKITPSTAARSIIGAAPHDEMMAYYARHGRFAPYQVQRLMAANLPSAKVLAVRLEADRIERLPVVKADIINAEGFMLADREHHTYATQRSTQLSATLLDLRNGRVIWTRQYRVNPQTVSESSHRVGDSVGTSIAAVMANTLVNGVGVKRHPAPPEIMDSVRALLQEVAYNVPIR